MTPRRYAAASGSESDFGKRNLTLRLGASGYVAAVAPSAMDGDRRRRRRELLEQREAMLRWRERLLARRTAQVEARRQWLRHLIER
jgi:hypothetical protein